MTVSIEDVVTIDRHKEIAIIKIDNPPVNALGHLVRQNLAAALDEIAGDDRIRAIVLTGAKGKFLGGADIREFGTPRKPPELATLNAMIEASDKPVVAAIDGFALGGGLEVALAAHYRIATPTAKLGLPEVNLGILPGAGGTQRGTRLLGPEKALDLMLSGRHVPADEALSLGLVDELSGRDLLADALSLARSKVAAAGRHPVLIERSDKVTGFDPSIFENIRKANARKWQGLFAPFKIVECVEAACTMAPRDGLAFEREASTACMASPARMALMHLFFAERKAAKIPGIPATAKPLPITRVGVIGAGTMGGGIAMALVNAGLSVKLLELEQAALDRGIDRIRGLYETSLSRGSTTREKVDEALGRIEGVIDYAALGDVDLVIEAVFEDMTVKKDVFARLDAVTKPTTILATNTSTMDINAIASATQRPEAVVGMHFFSPANVMRLVENIRGKASSDVAVVTAMAFAKQLGKIAVLANNKDGFIGNRILKVYGREAEFLLEEGATPWQVDDALKAFGFPMGVFLMRDLAGLDVSWRVRRYRAKTRNPKERYSPIADRICELGRFGQKTGAGYYRYDGRTATPDPEVEVLIGRVSSELGIARKTITDEEIVDRILAAMVNEAAFILEEKVAQRASDIDVVYCHGYGFPKHEGGPMFWAEKRGFKKVLEIVRRYHAEQGDLWRPAPLLELLAENGGSWASLDS
jgi:3-hydroxyacyl-CoA dehydrogenase